MALGMVPPKKIYLPLSVCPAFKISSSVSLLIEKSFSTIALISSFLLILLSPHVSVRFAQKIGDILCRVVWQEWKQAARSSTFANRRAKHQRL